ncbi:sulfite transporter TauE/SafE [Acinetobacter sp. ANC 5054]|uniref:sulfite exporter TauE/SafE family protein n=1 Tax=Acinetobacter sp. ANC 5054 TaxID=1977877 RepID=UPI000A32ED46|nr:sulfite exporter TauE/SafE family protein [Acinetobacter sp. ANC 5054]OTG79899.1 sulfite transporter TauE/SafE [Acinetobacter sp. ANC 5054]
MTWLIFILGAIFAGFVQGLTGFAFALIAMSFWVWILPPQIAAPLVVCASVYSHFISLSSERKSIHFDKRIILPYLVAGILGVPLGTYLLDSINQDSFKLVLGGFLVFWCPILFFNPKFNIIQKSGKWADSVIGYIAGILGGLGGFCGALPSAWLMLKNKPKSEQRYILRHFNLAIQLVTLVSYLIQGLIHKEHLPYLGVLLVIMAFPVIFGARLFYKISERQFKNIVLGLLFASGCFLVTMSLIT